MSILMVTGIEGARNCAALVGAQLGMEVEVAEGRKVALTALRRREFSVVVVDETVAECDPAGADAICEHAGLAIPLQINFALSGERDSSARFAPRCTAGSGSRHWPVRRPRRPSRRN